MSRSRIKCAHCERRIRDHEPDLVLRDLNRGGRARYYHTRCSNAAFAAAAESPGLYKLIVRHVEAIAN
jgi:hypothetical protein